MNWRKQSLQWHNKLGWVALSGILIWAMSGITHPMMAWFGPDAARFFPPSMQLQSADLAQLPKLLADTSVTSGARVIKVVPGEVAPLLQLTDNEQQPRRYYSLASGEAVPGQDLQQARWLASYYSGLSAQQINEIRLQTSFSSEYPEVNRLLPVYRITFTGEQDLLVFVHTETGALASFSNRNKSRLQGVFRQLHTFAWLDGVEYGRLLLMGMLLLTLAAFAATGLALVFALKSRRIAEGKRRYHRVFAYLLWLPLLGWSASGFYHLLQSSLVPVVTGLRLGAEVSGAGANADFSWLEQLNGRALNSISLVAGPEGESLYRVGFAPQAADVPQNRSQRFDGRPQEAGALFVNAASGKTLNGYSDREQALLLASRFASAAGGFEQSGNVKTELVTRYGPDYDFRNKRLPVWRIDLQDEKGSMLFVDPISGLLVDRSRSVDRTERLSFSLLHKWSHLAPFIGRQARDILIVATLLLLLGSSAIGGIMLARRRKRARPAVETGASVDVPLPIEG